jgi:CheY-like chemotaxis protein
MLKHIMLNLISNASKFSGESKPIEVKTENCQNQIILSVKDYGIGISKEDQKHLMERFFRGANAGNIQGTGLGLHIVSKYAELMNGTLECKSELEQGTEFIISFNKLFEMKILLIEDNEEIRNNTAEILELSNYLVIAAENGKAGIEKAIESKPDLIICDIMMPELDGYGVLHAVQKNDKIKNTPFIFLTAKTERSEMRKGMELGADDYITKPFSGTELLNAIDGRLKKLESLKNELTPGLDGLGQLMKAATGRNA